MTLLFFLLSGEHETLPSSEVKAILEAEGYLFRVSEKLDQLLIIEAEEECLNAVRSRAAYTKLCGVELIACGAKQEEIVNKLCGIDLRTLLSRGESFAVRIKRVKNYASEVNIADLERQLGAMILQMTENTKVNLENPDKTFTGILTENKFIFGLQFAEISPKFSKRSLKHRPFTHPSAMQPKLARAMVNLARAKAGKLVLDPFCGTGSILIEAALMGCRILGMDIQRRMVKGALKNFSCFDITPEGMIVADVKNLPLNSVEYVVGDPPYGRSATTMKRTPGQVIKEALQAIHPILEGGGYVCIAAPEEVNVSNIGMSLGYSLVESHFVYVHGSLTREVAVFRKE